MLGLEIEKSGEEKKYSLTRHELSVSERIASRRAVVKFDHAAWGCPKNDLANVGDGLKELAN